jgi:hypothetical protein
MDFQLLQMPRIGHRTGWNITLGRRTKQPAGNCTGLDWIGKGGTFLFGNFSPPKPFPIRNPRPAASGESEQCRRRGALLGSMIDHRQFAAQRDRESKSGHHNLLNNLRLCL